MTRRRVIKKYSYSVDPIYQSVLIDIFVNRLMRHGKKSISYRILYSVLDEIQNKTQREPLAILEHAVCIVTPTVQLKSRRIGGSIYQVPVEVSIARGLAIAIQWILAASTLRSIRGRIDCISAEVMAAACGIGGAVRKREEVYRIAEANKAVARYRFLSYYI
jgi:small subunit ribosomal protein S7